MITLYADILPASPRHADRCFDTGRVLIGLAHIPTAAPVESLDAIKLQRALLDSRTTHQPGLLASLINGVYKWL